MSSADGGPGSEQWLKKRGILEEVWNERPYKRYVPEGLGESMPFLARTDGGSTTVVPFMAPSGLAPVFEEYGDGGLYEDQVMFADKIARGGEDPYRDEHPETKDGGFLIMRHAPPGLKHYGKVYAEMRPDNAVATRKRTWHYHGPRPYPAHVEIDAKSGLPRKPKEAGRGPIGKTHLYTAKQMKEHIDRREYEDDHFDGDERLAQVHCHQRVAKYTFIMGHWFTQEVQYKDGSWHEKKMQDESESIARRIDMHPLAYERFQRGVDVFYFAAEGCIKADAILSEIIRRDLRATVASVPSVTLWRAEEFEDFINLYLRGHRVVVVSDADGARNPKVRTQMLLLRSFLWNRGVHETEVVAPPYPGSKQAPGLGWVPKRKRLDEPVTWELRPGVTWVADPSQFDDKGKPKINGVDDLIGSALKDDAERAPLDELKRLGNQVNEDVWEWVRSHPRKNTGKSSLGDARDALALESVCLHASPPDEEYPYWTCWASAKMNATVLEYGGPKTAPPKKVPYKQRKRTLPAQIQAMQEAMLSLVDRGALEKIAGSDEIKMNWVRTKNGWRSTGYEYSDRPRYRIVPQELEPRELTRRALSELPEVEFYNRVADFLQERVEGKDTANFDSIEKGTKMLATIDERLARIELLESMRAETMDHIRDTVERIAARFPDDENIQVAVEPFLTVISGGRA